MQTGSSQSGFSKVAVLSSLQEPPLNDFLLKGSPVDFMSWFCIGRVVSRPCHPVHAVAFACAA